MTVPLRMAFEIWISDLNLEMLQKKLEIMIIR